jgi:glycosyltransferase involved in cell wall biosynthesis
MAALFRPDNTLDPSQKASDVLEYVLHETDESVVKEKEVASSVREELKEASVITQVSTRAKSRVLFVTADITVLSEGSVLQNHFRNIASAFEEVHVIVLSTVYESKKGIIRLDTNLWLYTTSVKSVWKQPFAALALARSELQFAAGFRPDIVVALDPFLSGLIGLEIAKTYEREFQVHVLEDFLSPFFIESHEYGAWKVRLAKYVLKRTMSIRTRTEIIRTKVAAKITHTKDIEVLPKYVDIASLTQSVALPEQSPDMFAAFSFVILFVGDLDYDSTLFRAIDAARSALFSKGIALVVAGDGPAKKEFEQRAEILGVKEQVVFLKDTGLLPQYFKNADILLCTDVTEASDDIVVKAAAAGLPILAAQNHFREDLFEDGVDAFLCPPEDTVCFSQKLIKFLNTNALRQQFETNAKDIVSTRLRVDPEIFRLAYRNSIEAAFEHE